jgi:hypothetical protein
MPRRMEAGRRHMEAVVVSTGHDRGGRITRMINNKVFCENGLTHSRFFVSGSDLEMNGKKLSLG